jgi:short-subunit dehydrogenase
MKLSAIMDALRFRARKSNLPIFVTEIRPGFVDTAMMKARHPFWVISAAVAARRIVAAVDARKPFAHVPRRWRLVACLMRLLPDVLYAKVA